MSGERIVAVAMLPQRQLDDFGQSLQRVWPVDETPCFGALLHLIDEADREIWRERDRIARPAARQDEVPTLLIIPSEPS